MASVKTISENPKMDRVPFIEKTGHYIKKRNVYFKLKRITSLIHQAIGSMTGKRAWVTLLTRPSYLAGVIILAYTLRRHGSQIPLIVLVTDTLPPECADVLKAEDHGSGLLVVKQVDHLIPSRQVNMVAERFVDTWTKLRAFELVEYDTVVFLDADIMIMGEMDSLFNVQLPAHDWLGAAHACVCNVDKDPWALPDWNRANCPHTAQRHPEALEHGAVITRESPSTYHLMNSGVFLFHPSRELWDRTRSFLDTTPLLATFIFPDQNFLDEFFRHRWIALGWQWNAIKTHRYWHPNLWCDDGLVRALHYIVDKPWQKRIGSDGVAGHLGRDGVTHAWWWDVYGEWERERTAGGSGPSGSNVVEVVRRHIAPPLDES